MTETSTSSDPAPAGTLNTDPAVAGLAVTDPADTVPRSPAPAPPDRPGGTRRRAVAMTIWGAAFTAAWLWIGLPTDPVYAFVCLWTATIAWNSHRPARSHLGFARDWLPIVLLLVAYNFSRGYADEGVAPHVQELIDADREMWGWFTGGEVPTIWLQERLFDPMAAHWWDVLASFVYFSHFVVSLAIAVVLWLRNRQRWAGYMRRFFFLTAAGLATYFLYPAAPPWWAAVYGYLPPVQRISTRGWREIGLHGAGNMLNHGQLAANPVAAMPSLHSAFALFAVVFLAMHLRKRWWPVLAAYPLAMTFTLVYSGEHYMIDVLFGWAYVIVTFLAVGLAERLWAARRPTRTAVPSR